MKFAVGRVAIEFGLWGLLGFAVVFLIIGFLLDRYIKNEKIRSGFLFGLGSVAAVIVFWYKDFMRFG